MSEVWAQKHRPTTLWDIVGQEEVVRNINNPGHYIFYSPQPGTGKTTTALALAKDMDWPIHIFNASTKNERGIAFIEEQVIPMTRTGNYNQWFLLDEADQLTDAAQSALKGVIENAQGYFILTCNNLSKVSPWLQSRCSVKHFKPISEDNIIKILSRVAAIENLKSGVPNAINCIAKAHAGDARNAINALQAWSYLKGDQRTKFLANLGTPQVDYDKFLRVAVRERSFDSAVKILKGHPLKETFRGLLSYLMESGAKQESKMRIVLALIESERDLIAGIHPDLILANFVRSCIPRGQA
jgi:DNA polymerase III delta prime subunit